MEEAGVQSFAGALDHADATSVVDAVAAMPWRYPSCVQLLIMDQEETYFRLHMYRDGAWRQYAPPPPPDADEQQAW